MTAASPSSAIARRIAGVCLACALAAGCSPEPQDAAAPIAAPPPPVRYDAARDEAPREPPDVGQLRERLRNATVDVPGDGAPDVRVRLDGGRADYRTDSEHGTVELIAVLGAVPTPDGADVFADVSVIRGGSGDFRYLMLFHDAGAGLRQTSSFLVGDRVVPNGIEAELTDDATYTLRLEYLDRGEGEAMAEPAHLPRELELEVAGHRILTRSAR
ncbi:hypothetical protein [Coralloluteibacterium stylophorae]|uniref:Uncharacterized protein n=1 Tax=Coralloluteibacterium stylophorae TaxID=1776034 RepID=A0AAP2C9F9_9GAMM|nr:hypothetical protein [Coralloluteibacterium stylophorae]MBS7456290.1 hypothetical protein [Coralloluteibacterium stylophorae]